MPIAGVALVGLLDQGIGMKYLAEICVPTNPAPVALQQEWAAAQAALQHVNVPNVGQPNIRPMSRQDQQHVNALVQQPQYQLHAAIGKWAAAGRFAWVEIAPLLAYQIQISLGAAQGHASPYQGMPTDQQLLDVCLPINPRLETPRTGPGRGKDSILFVSENLNLRNPGALFLPSFVLRNVMQANGQVGDITFPGGVGVAVAMSQPYVQVVRWNNLHILHNGYHRAYGAAVAGATHIPCIIRDVQTLEEVGILPEGTFTGADLLKPQPPTLGHYVSGHAHQVQLRKVSRAISVSWSEYIIPDEL